MLLQVRIHTDILTRSRRDLPRHVSCYDIGFPCQPFSLLHNNSSLFEEEAVEVFREAMRTIYSISPLLCILENVVGLLRCWHLVIRYLEKLTSYFFAKLIVDPKRLGDCVQRRRVYIVLIHKYLGVQVTAYLSIEICQQYFHYVIVFSINVHPKYLGDGIQSFVQMASCLGQWQRATSTATRACKQLWKQFTKGCMCSRNWIRSLLVLVSQNFLICVVLWMAQYLKGVKIECNKKAEDTIALPEFSSHCARWPRETKKNGASKCCGIWFGLVKWAGRNMPKVVETALGYDARTRGLSCQKKNL